MISITIEIKAKKSAILFFLEKDKICSRKNSVGHVCSPQIVFYNLLSSLRLVFLCATILSDSKGFSFPKELIITYIIYIYFSIITLCIFSEKWCIVMSLFCVHVFVPILLWKRLFQRRVLSIAAFARSFIKRGIWFSLTYFRNTFETVFIIYETYFGYFL